MTDSKNTYSLLRNIFLISYLLMSIAAIPIYRFELSPDAISYYGIAQKYALFNFSDAVNAYWSPLI